VSAFEARFAAWDRGRLAGAEDALAGREVAKRLADDELATPEFSSAYFAGYRAGREPDVPWDGPPAPLWWSVPGTWLGALLTAWARVDGRWDWRRVAVAALAVLPGMPADRALRRRRARRLGLERLADAPPPPPVIDRAIPSTVGALARRWDLRRRGRWPMSAATGAGQALANAIASELAFRRVLRAWRGRTAR
jgi:hypothetical protein